MRDNLFAKMSHEDLKTIYKNYTEWRRTDVIPQPSKLAEIAKEYGVTRGDIDFIHFMEYDFLRECAKRLFENNTASDYVIVKVPRNKIGRPSKQPSDTELHMRYEIQKQTRRELAELYNVSEPTIARWLSRAGCRKYKTASEKENET